MPSIPVRWRLTIKELQKARSNSLYARRSKLLKETTASYCQPRSSVHLKFMVSCYCLYSTSVLFLRSLQYVVMRKIIHSTMCTTYSRSLFEILFSLLVIFFYDNLTSGLIRSGLFTLILYFFFRLFCLVLLDIPGPTPPPTFLFSLFSLPCRGKNYGLTNQYCICMSITCMARA